MTIASIGVAFPLLAGESLPSFFFPAASFFFFRLLPSSAPESSGVGTAAPGIALRARVPKLGEVRPFPFEEEENPLPPT